MNNEDKAEDSLILRDVLALERTRLANERTLLSYARTSLYLVVGGVALLKFEEFDNTDVLAIIVIIFSALLFVFAVWRYIKLRRKIKTQLNKQVGF